jgi:hypothetical protein
MPIGGAKSDHQKGPSQVDETKLSILWRSESNDGLQESRPKAPFLVVFGAFTLAKVVVQFMS